MPRIIATVGAPRSGKSTFAEKFDLNEWVTCTFDDFRQTLWPPNRRIYWNVRKGPNGDKAQELLHRVKYHAISSALDLGFNVITPDTHTREREVNQLKEVADVYSIKIEWKVLEVPWDVLKFRNDNSDIVQGHKVPEDILKTFYERLWAPDAWWLKEENVEIIRYNGEGVTI